MNSKMLDMVLGLVGLVGLVFGIWKFVQFVEGWSPTNQSLTNVWIALVGIAIACACALGIFLRNVQKEEEIHITQ